MGRILEATPAGLLVVVGGKSAAAFRSAYPSAVADKPQFGRHGPEGLLDASDNVFEFEIGGRTRLVCFIKHPAAYGGSVQLETQYPGQFERIRNAARGRQ